MIESVQTHEDSSTISSKVSQQLTANTTKVRSVVVTFDQNIHNLVKVGTKVLPRDYLCIIEDSVTGESGLLSEDTIEALKRFSNNAPKAKCKGFIDKIEVLYHGDKEDMSSTLRSLANSCDSMLRASAKSVNQTEHTGSVNSDYRVAGNPLTLDTAEIKFYITLETDAGVADKVVFSGQLKSTICEVMHYQMKTEDGKDVDSTFGCTSIMARIVESANLIGTTNTLLIEAGERAYNAYKGK